MDGVRHVTGLATGSASSPLIADGQRTSVRVWLVEPELADLQREAPVTPLPERVFAADDPPAIVTLGGTMVAPDAERPSLGRLGTVEVAGHLDQLPGAQLPSGVVVSRERWEAAHPDTPPARIILVDTVEGADLGEVVPGVTDALDGVGVVTTVQERLDRFRSAPVTEGLVRMFLGATVVSGLLTVLAVVVVQLMGATARARLLAVLRTLGLAPGQSRALTAWELAPLLLTSVVVGTLLGLAVPWVLLRGLDLTGLTGGVSQPALVLDPLTITAVLGAVVLTVAAAVVVSAWLAGRTNLAQALRVGEER